MFDFILIVPCYSYAKGIEGSFKQIEKWREKNLLNCLVCFVDDGSIDNTKEILTNLCGGRSWARLLSYSDNRGKGYAIRYAVEKVSAEAPICIFTDCDLYYGLDVIQDKIIPALNTGNDIAILDRSWSRQFHTSSGFRRLLSKGFNHLKTLLTSVTFKDSQAGLKGFRSDAIRGLLPMLKINGFAFDVELLSLATLYRLRVIQIPIRDTARNVTSGTSITFGGAVGMFLDLLRIAWGRYFGTYRSEELQKKIEREVYTLRDTK